MGTVLENMYKLGKLILKYFLKISILMLYDGLQNGPFNKFTIVFTVILLIHTETVWEQSLKIPAL